MSVGGGSNKSNSSSTSQSNRFGFNESQSYLDAGQRAAQEQLQGSFLGTLQNYQTQIMPGIQEAQLGLINQLGLGNTPAADRVRTRYGGTGGAAGPGYRPQEYQDYEFNGLTSMDQLAQYASGENPYLQGQVDQLGDDITRQYGRFNQQLGGMFGAGGSRGSSRHGIAEGMGLESHLENYTRGVTDLRASAYDTASQAAAQLAGFDTQRYGAHQGLQGSLAGAAATRSAAAMSASASRYSADRQAETQQGAQRLAAIELAQQGLQQYQNMTFAPFQIGAGVIGNPAVLNSSWGMQTGESTSSSSGNSSGWNSSVGLW